MDMRKIVEKGYDNGNYAEHYRQENKLNKLETKLLLELIKNIPKKGKILDFGSGTGIPYDSYLAKKGFDVTGIDISKKHIAMAKKNVPNAKFIKGDFSKRSLKDSFDAIVSFYAIFHVPRSEHKNILKKMHTLLHKDGYMLITLGFNEMKMNIDKFIDSKMAWSSYSAEKNKKLVAQSGFKIMLTEEEYQGNEHHLWILAQKTTFK
jgi:2-polyprenyl-3-methyl-5-hydroxy-6-metoxy-1,4-benzoquinol methylase